MTTTIEPNQTFLDAVLMQYGTVEAAMQVALANDMSITETVTIEQQLRLPGGATTDRTVNTYLQKAGITIGTRGIN